MSIFSKKKQTNQNSEERDESCLLDRGSLKDYCKHLRIRVSGRPRKGHIDIDKLDFSPDKYVICCDKALESWYKNWSNEIYSKFGPNKSIIAEAIIFNYVDRHPDDPVGLNKYVSETLVADPDLFKDDSVSPQNSSTDWINDSEHCYNPNLRGLYDIDFWASADPSIRFYHTEINLLGSSTSIYLVRQVADKFEFIRFERTKLENTRNYFCRECDADGYRAFLREMWEITKKWYGHYEPGKYICVCDGGYDKICCPDIKLSTGLQNASPENYGDYYKCRCNYFGEKYWGR